MKHFNIIALMAFFLLGAVAVRADEISDFKPGKNTSLRWSRMDINMCLSDYKPILLYVYDVVPHKNNPVAYRFERDVFTDVIFQKSFPDFNCVMIQMNNTGWPEALRSFAKGGAAVMVMTCDAKPLGTWQRYNNSTANEITTSAAEALANNARAAADLKKNPPKPYVDPGIPSTRPPTAGDKSSAPAAPAAPAFPVPEKDPAGLPGLTSSKKDVKDPKADNSKADPKKADTAKVNPPPKQPVPPPVPEKAKKTLADEE